MRGTQILILRINKRVLGVKVGIFLRSSFSYQRSSVTFVDCRGFDKVSMTYIPPVDLYIEVTKKRKNPNKP